MPFGTPNVGVNGRYIGGLLLGSPGSGPKRDTMGRVIDRWRKTEQLLSGREMSATVSSRLVAGVQGLQCG